MSSSHRKEQKNLLLNLSSRRKKNKARNLAAREKKRKNIRYSYFTSVAMFSFPN